MLAAMAPTPAAAQNLLAASRELCAFLMKFYQVCRCDELFVLAHVHGLGVFQSPDCFRNLSI